MITVEPGEMYVMNVSSSGAVPEMGHGNRALETPRCFFRTKVLEDVISASAEVNKEISTVHE
jgi:hypothetical protein